MKRIALLLLLLATVGTAAHAQAPTARKPSGTHYLVLIRHGMYDYDSTVTDDSKGNALNRLGHEQARLTGERLKRLPVRFRSLVASPYLRASETAADIGTALGIVPVIDTLVHECTPRFESRPEYTRIETDEGMAACEANLQAAYGKYFVPTPEADTHDVIVCHGNVIRWLLCKSLGMDPLLWRRFTLGNGSLTVFAVAPDGVVRLAAYSDTGHIPVEKQTWTGRGPGWLPPPPPRAMR